MEFIVAIVGFFLGLYSVASFLSFLPVLIGMPILWGKNPFDDAETTVTWLFASLVIPFFVLAAYLYLRFIKGQDKTDALAQAAGAPAVFILKMFKKDETGTESSDDVSGAGQQPAE